MKVYNNNQLYKSPAGDQLWNSGRHNWIFGRIGDQEGAISDPVNSKPNTIPFAIVASLYPATFLEIAVYWCPMPWSWLLS